MLEWSLLLFNNLFCCQHLISFVVICILGTLTSSNKTAENHCNLQGYFNTFIISNVFGKLILVSMTEDEYTFTKYLNLKQIKNCILIHHYIDA